MADDKTMQFSPEQAFDFIQKMWNPLGFAMPGMNGAANFPNPMAMFATIDPVEVERKINELKVVEQWLTMNLNLLQMSIKTLEWQKSSLEAMRSPTKEAK